MGTIESVQPFYTLEGNSCDVETIIRLRAWMEEEIYNSHGEFRSTKLITDYIEEDNIFEFKILFYR